MARRSSSRPTASTSRAGRVLGCFDKELCIRRDLFEDAVTICDIKTEAPPQVPTGRATTLRFGAEDFEMAWVLDWLTPLATESGRTYYIHHHDNIVVEVALFEPYERAAFRRRLRLFRTRPAAEGGSNLLGVIDAGGTWVLVLANDNQGKFRIAFLGPAKMCRGLRLCRRLATRAARREPRTE